VHARACSVTPERPAVTRDKIYVYMGRLAMTCGDILSSPHLD
jgi:hypothetical protein